MKFTVALLQIRPNDNDQNKNLEKGIEYCKKAKELNADLVLFPELWNIGFSACPFDEKGKKEWVESAIDQRSEFFQSFVKCAREVEINIALTYLEKYSSKPKNSVSIINRNGEVVLNYSKVFICNFGQEELLKDDPVYDEIGCDYNCTPGKKFPVCSIYGKGGEVKIGSMICADREFPEAATQLMIKGAELIVVPNSCRWDQIRTDLLKARAFENFVGIAMTNYPAPNANGNSQAYDCVAWENGNERDTFIVKAGEEEGIFMATFDLDEIRQFRKEESWRINYRKNWYKS